MSELETVDKAGGLPAFLKRKREEMGLSLRELAARLPITASTVGMLENGEHVPAMPVLRAIAKVFKTPLSEIEGMLPAGATPREKIPGKDMSEQAEDLDKMGMHGRPDFRRLERDHDKDDDDMGPNAPTMGATSFAQVIEAERAQDAAREVRKLANQVPVLVEGIFQDPNIEDKDAAIADLGPEFSALVMEGMAAKERWQPLTDAVVKAIAPLIDIIKPAAPTKKEVETPPETQTKNSFLVYKEADGGYRWLAIYSNKFRDRDNPPEIISEASHRRFTKMVNSGQLPFPELRLAHVKGSRWGVADFVGYDDKGFAVGTGSVDKDKEWVAEALMNNGEEILTSHGMPPSSIKRDPQDHTIYLEHTTTEISPLLASKAANEFTGFSILDEVKEMAFSEEERAKLSDLGVDPDRLEAETESKAKETEGLEFKEADKPKVATETDNFVSRDEVADLVKSVAASTNQLVQVVGDMVKRVEALEANKLTLDQKTLEETPGASLADLYKSVIGSPETKVDGRSALAKSAPEETKPDTSAPGLVGSRSGGGLAAVIAQRNQEIERGGVQ